MLVKLAWLALAYLIGSFPFGLLVAQSSKGIDPRTEGSMNIGATNIARLCGTKLGVLTLLLDGLKGFLPVVVARAISPEPWFVGVTALLCVIGHMFPIFLYYKGGKGVATTIGAFLAMAPGATIAAGVLCVAAIAWSGYVSVGSLLFAVAIPFTVYFFSSAALTPIVVLVSALVIWKHKENIKRLRAGEEKPWREKGKKGFCCSK